MLRPPLKPAIAVKMKLLIVNTLMFPLIVDLAVEAMFISFLTTMIKHT